MGIEHTIARLLTWGTYLGVAFLVLGVLGMLLVGVSPLDPTWPALDIGAIPGQLLSLEPIGFLWTGLLVVIATPPARVAAALFGYVRTGDRAMAAVSVGILVVIATAVVLGAESG
jgi:uncharacterized membrane protein